MLSVLLDAGPRRGNRRIPQTDATIRRVRDDEDERITGLLLDPASAWDPEADAETNFRAVVIVRRELDALGALLIVEDGEMVQDDHFTVDPTALLVGSTDLLLHFARVLASERGTSVLDELAEARAATAGAR